MPRKRVIAVVLVAIRKDNKILLLKRAKSPLKGYWGLIGGKLKIEERLEDAAIRETKEETGIDSEFIATRAVLHERLFEKKKTKYGYVLFLTEVKPKTFNIESSHEGEVRWFDIKKLENKKIIFSDLWMIKKLLNKRTKVYNVVMKEKSEKIVHMRID